jgi:hypothetical protein
MISAVEKFILPMLLKLLGDISPKKKRILILVLSAVVIMSVIIPVIPRMSPVPSQTLPEIPEHGTSPAGAVKPEESSLPDRFYKIVYMKNGAEGTGPVSGEVRAGSAITIKSGDTLSKWRSIFSGWKSDTGTYYNAGDSVNNISGNITLIAQWKPFQSRDETKKIMIGETRSFF